MQYTLKLLNSSGESPINFETALVHLLTNHMGILKKRFYDVGMKDVLLQSATIAEGSIE